jgi:hypothetical protein
VRACPFLTQRDPGLTLSGGRTIGLPDEAIREAGAQPGVLFHLGEPLSIACYRDGRPATREEIAAAIDKGLPYPGLTLAGTAASQGPQAVAALWAQLLAQQIGGSVDATNRLVSPE